jgi:hypothetical protein
MGDVRDLFRPMAGASYCDMLVKGHNFEWGVDGVEWFTPRYYMFCCSNGGSSHLYSPGDDVDGDMRDSLSFWGTDPQRKDSSPTGWIHLTGGCCSSSPTEYQTRNPEIPNMYTEWGQSFNFSYATPYFILPPPNTDVTLFVDTDGTAVLDDVFWNVQCQKVPERATFLMLDMVRCSFLLMNVFARGVYSIPRDTCAGLKPACV